MRLSPFQYPLIDHPDLCATSSRLLAVKLAALFGYIKFGQFFFCRMVSH
jgi:hypothetical protein